MSRPTSPTAKRRQIAITLRRLREQRTTMTAADASKRVDKNPAWLSKVELAQVRPNPNDVRALLHLYDVHGPEAEAVIDVARQAAQKGWWRRYSDIMPDWFTDYVGLESAASAIRTYEAQVVPGLLQTEDYARAAIARAPVSSTNKGDEIERQVALRLERQQILAGDDPPLLGIVLDESALRRMVGGKHVLREQVEHLLAMSDRPNVELQVLELDAGVGLDGSFVTLEFPAPPEPFPRGVLDDRLVYVNTLAGALYLDEPAELAIYADVFENLRAEALSSEKTRSLLRRIAKDLTG